jgi:hypothetical protein
LVHFTGMTADELTKARAFRLGLEGNAKVYAQITTEWMAEAPFRLFWEEIQRIKATFPDLLPAADRNTFILRAASAGGYLYSVVAVKSYVEMAVGRLRARIEEQSENTPITERREFNFVSNPKLRTILERDYDELQRAFVAKCWKAVIILSGGGIEAILTDLLELEAVRARRRRPLANPILLDGT